MASTDNRPPARLLMGLARTRDAAVWGFPFDIMANIPKTSPPKESYTEMLGRYTTNISTELATKCEDLWSFPGMYNTPAYVRLSPRKKGFIFAVIKCTRRDDRFLPPPEIVEHMKAIFAAAGYTGEPGWFIELSL